MDYKFVNIAGEEIVVPHEEIVEYNDLELVGRDTKNWNEPIQYNFVKIADKIKVLEEKLGIE